MRPPWFGRKRGHKNPSAFQRTKIARSAVEAFLARPHDSFAWIKDSSLKDLKEYVFEQWNAFHTAPRQGQLACFALGVDLKEFLFNLDCGVGKSWLFLNLIRYHRFHNKAQRFLILVPNRVNIQAWEDQIAAHAPDLSYQALIGTREQRHQMINDRAGICLLNYAGLQSYMTETGTVKVKRRGKEVEQRKRIVNYTAADDFADLWDGIILDEIHNIGVKDSLVYRLCKRLSRHSTIRYGGTGTLFGNNPEMMWTQFDLIDHGYTLGETLGLYRAAFFEEKQDFWKGIKYDFDKTKASLLHQFIQHRSIYYPASACGDLPQVSRIKERLTWSDDQLLYYDRVRAECKARGSIMLNPNTYITMRQIASGFVGYSTDDGKAKLQFEDNPKLERLLQVINEMPLDSKVVVYHEYIFTGQIIRDALKKNKIRCAEMWGGVKDTAAQYRTFTRDPGCRVLVANYKSGGTGANYHDAANYVYYFESPPDPINRKQSNDRVDRLGQKKKVFVYDPIMPGGIDEKILEYLDAGKDLQKAVNLGKVQL